MSKIDLTEKFDPKIGGFAYFIEQQRVAAAKEREV